MIGQSHISANGRLVAAATKDLMRNWAATKESWSDAKALDFEQRFLSELMSSVDHAAPVFEDLEKLIKKIRSDCE
jgi:hypothetical protein